MNSDLIEWQQILGGTVYPNAPFSLMITPIVFGFGWFSRKRILWVFAIGIGLYLIDGLLFLKLGDVRSAAFHCLGIAFMVRGFDAFRQLAKADKEQLNNDVSVTLKVD